MNQRKPHEEWTELLTDYMNGDLGAERHAEVEEHLATCGACRDVLEELRAVVSRAAALGPIEPARDLWGGIAATIQAPPAVDDSGARVIALPTAERIDAELASTKQRFNLTGRQLLAASIVLVVASSLATWSLGRAATGPVADTLPTATVPGVIVPATQVVDPPLALAEELATLEQAVVEARGLLDPNTIRLLERNLAVIEQAIADSQRALQQDPENDFLVEHLERVYQRKLEYLRDAARVAEQAG